MLISGVQIAGRTGNAKPSLSTAFFHYRSVGGCTTGLYHDSGEEVTRLVNMSGPVPMRVGRLDPEPEIMRPIGKSAISLAPWRRLKSDHFDVTAISRQVSL